MFEHTDAMAKAARAELHGLDIIHQACGFVIIIGEAVLPGYLARTIAGPRDDRDRDAIARGLASAKVLDDDIIRGWFIDQRDRYPAFASYIMHLECVRLAAIQVLSEDAGGRS